MVRLTYLDSFSFARIEIQINENEGKIVTDFDKLTETFTVKLVNADDNDYIFNVVLVLIKTYGEASTILKMVDFVFEYDYNNITIHYKNWKTTLTSKEKLNDFLCD